MNEKQQKPVTLLTVTGLFAAIITLMTAYICHIPYGANGGYIHFGDIFGTFLQNSRCRAHKDCRSRAYQILAFGRRLRMPFDF